MTKKLNDRLEEHMADITVLGKEESTAKQSIKADLLGLIEELPTWTDASRNDWVSPRDIKKAIQEYTK